MKRLVSALVVLCACAEAIAASRPVAERAAVRLLREPAKDGNAILFVQFGRTPAAKRVLTLDEEQGATTLRDDGAAPDEKAGDGIHSAYLRVDVAQLRTRQERMLAAKSLPLFVGREVVGHATAVLSREPVALKDLAVIPNATNYVPPANGKELSLVLRFVPIRPGVLIPIYPTLFSNESMQPATPAAGAARLSGKATKVPAIMVIEQDADPSIIVTKAALLDPDRTYQPCTATRGSMGNWTFGHLMSELAQDSGIAPAQFVQNWVDKWQATQTVNTFAVQPRTIMKRDIVDLWPRDRSGQLDLWRSPFVLVAIVNRIDLGQDNPYGGKEEDTAGEARFIFAATGFSNNGTDEPEDDLPCTPLPTLVIFEYKVPVSGCRNVKQWAQQWQDLESFFFQGDTYRLALEAITLQFTEAGTNPSQVPNHSSLAQIRTNIIMPESGLTPWELREFVLAADGNLGEVTVKQTPDISFNETTALADYALANATDILSGNYAIPETLSGAGFLAGVAPLPGNGGVANAQPQFFWDGPGPPPSTSLSGQRNLRHTLSLNTCNGCHGDETGTIFTHVSEKGELSKFMTGGFVQDPAGEKIISIFGRRRYFNDLERRRQRMAQILSDPCWGCIYANIFPFVH